MTAVDFWVPGVPVPKGSLRHVGNGRLVESAKGLADWRHAIKDAAWTYRLQQEPFDGPVWVETHFYLPRPLSHFRANDRTRDLKASAPQYPYRKPDLDKLVRAILDAVTDAGLWRDDAQVTWVRASKDYADDRIPGVRVSIEEAR